MHVTSENIFVGIHVEALGLFERSMSKCAMFMVSCEVSLELKRDEHSGVN